MLEEEKVGHRGILRQLLRCFCRMKVSPKVAGHACDLNPRKAEAGAARVQGQRGQHGEFKASLSYVRMSQNKER